MSETLSLPAGHPEQGFVEPDLSFEDGAGLRPQEEIDAAAERDEAQQADAALVEQAEHDTATAIHDERLDTSGLRVSSLVPSECSISGSELVLLHVFGSGFTETTQIWWHDHVEPTVFVSENELTTWVTPWAFFNPDVIEVGVEGGDQLLPFGLLP
jgi:hypothetical protein